MAGIMGRMVLPLLLVGCGTPGAIAWLDTGQVIAPMRVSADALEIGPTHLEKTATANLTVHSTEELFVSVRVDPANAGLSPDVSSLNLTPDAPGLVRVVYAPNGQLGPADAILWLESDVQTLQVVLSGVALADFDGDRSDHPLAGGDDCDDDDPEVHPGAAEIWYDGVDQDCDGNDTDQDGDGFAARAEGGDDCDDTDPESNPDGVERWYDGVDQDCDGDDADDQDEDGWAAAEAGGPDCDDADASVHPDLLDDTDGVDTDCDGLVDEDDLSAGAVLIVEAMAADRSAAGDAGQYLELWSTEPVDRDLVGWRLGAAVLDSVVIPAGGVLVLCPTGVSSPGLPCDATVADWPQLLSTGSGPSLVAGALTIHRLDWQPDWAWQDSAALQLDPGSHGSPESAASWCPATLPYGDGPDLGSPGAGNSACP